MSLVDDLGQLLITKATAILNFLVNYVPLYNIVEFACLLNIILLRLSIIILTYLCIV